MSLLLILQTLRPRQWTKNLVVLAAPIFARQLANPPILTRSILGVAVFCLLSGIVYLLNDLKDHKQDALHPVKSKRPIASGRLSVPTAWVALAVLLPAGLIAAWMLGPGFFTVAVAYLALNVLYSFVLRNMVILDVVAIATGFVLRAIAGAEVLLDAGVDAEISPWLLLCTFFLSLFLGLCKRRHERASAGEKVRSSLSGYTVDFLDRLIGITAAVTLLSYSIYTVVVGSTHMVYTVPFVFYGLARYLHLVLTEDAGGDPSEMLLGQKSIILTVLLWVLCVAWILYSDSAGGTGAVGVG